jgi:peptide/nickel transport system substrate-binding protein
MRLCVAFLIAGLLGALSNASAAPQHGLAMHGQPALPANFEHLPYANPDAHKGGRIVYGVLGTFDTLNPYAVRGVAAQGLTPPLGLVVQSLMMRSADEPFTLYGSIAESIDVPDDRSSVTFRINPKARFSDGHQISSDDVAFTWGLLKEKGKPNMRSSYGKVQKVETPDHLTIRFDLTGVGDRELPLILGLMPVLAKHTTDVEKFEETSLTPLLGSGPYLVADVKAGESITYKRNPDFWGKDLPINRGLYNVDEYKFDYYRDANTLFEAFKGGLYDIRSEDNPTRWVTGYDFPRMTEQKAVKDPIAVRTPKGMTALAMNTRKSIFSDVRTREALSYLFDFEWVNKSLFEGVYKRTSSYFEGSDLASTGLAASDREKTFLALYPEAVRADILSGTWRPPVSDGTGRDRNNAKKAFDLLKSAGWSLDKGVLKNQQGEAFAFEALVVTRVQERLALNFSESLQKLGIQMNVRYVDDVQYWRRVATFDFDMIQFTWGSSPSPGNEQANRWGSKSKDREGSLNYPGVASPAVDAAIEALLAARSREDFVDAVRVLDRLLLSGFYVVPLFNAPEQWIVRSTAVKRPDKTPLFGFAPETLWRVEN